MMTSLNKGVLILGLAGVFGLPRTLPAGSITDQPGQGSKLDPAVVKFFENSVRPVLANRCFQCHGPQKQKAKLRLDSRAGMLKGGESGPALKPGRPEESLFISAIKHGEIVQMPPKTKLPVREIADLTAWVKMGAPWPNAAPTSISSTPKGPAFSELQKSFWAFTPPNPPLNKGGPGGVWPGIPAVQNRGWVKSPIDAFIQAKLEARGWTPAPPADRRTLLRRATFDLTGLPPTPEDIEAFLDDSAADAFARVVDRLLASPHYGERWGRHWLDVARFADSNGMDENLAFANAFRYRDYVIRAFNQDKPYDQFVREQIAGDLLPAATPDSAAAQLIATGFLCLGPKMLAEDDPVKMEMDIIDEQVDTIGRTFLGLTLGCARCHDHKFDPIATADYYALAGIFKSTKTMDNFRVVARWHERVAGSKEDQERLQHYEARLAKIKEQIDKLVKTAAGAAELKQRRDELAALQKSPPPVAEAMAVSESAIVNLRIHLRGSHLNLGKEVPRRFPLILSNSKVESIGPSQTGRLQLAHWLTRPDNPLTSRVLVNRLWHWHFGAGLVRSTDNFGLLGDRPAHQPLLDWLAVRFVDSGWSIKAMHRLIMLSSTYQMSTAYNDKAAAGDPENRLHWRMNRRRLEAEAIRDALLAVSGQLDPAMGGSLLEVKNRQYVTSTANVNYDKYDSKRRSVYLPVIRSALYDVFQAFDFADPSVPNGERAVTTVAPQALFMMNSKLVLEQTRALADLLLRQKTSDEERIRLAYGRCYGRPASDQEVRRAVDFLQRLEPTLAKEEPNLMERRRRAWHSLCRVLVAVNEFIFVE